MALIKRHAKALERLFEAEINGALNKSLCCVQSKAAVFKELEAAGLAEFRTHDLGRDRFGRVTVMGWELTVAGHAAYCFWAAETYDFADEED